VIDEYVIAASLDDQWRTVQAIKRKSKERGRPEQIAAALRHLAEAGKIDKQEQPIELHRRWGSGARRLGPQLKIAMYRRRS